jgi:hypothetical protein
LYDAAALDDDRESGRDLMDAMPDYGIGVPGQFVFVAGGGYRSNEFASDRYIIRTTGWEPMGTKPFIRARHLA